MSCIEKVKIKKPCPRTEKVCKKPQCPECHGEGTILVWASKVYREHIFDGRGICIRCRTFKNPAQKGPLDYIGDFLDSALRNPQEIPSGNSMSVLLQPRTTEIIYADDELEDIREEIARIKEWREEIERKSYQGLFTAEEKAALMRRVEALERTVQNLAGTKNKAPEVDSVMDEVQGLKRKINWKR